MNLNDHIREIEKEFDERFGALDEMSPYAARLFYHGKLREIATASLAACRVPENKFPARESDEYDGGYAHAISEQKKKAEEWLNLKP